MLKAPGGTFWKPSPNVTTAGRYRSWMASRRAWMPRRIDCGRSPSTAGRWRRSSGGSSSGTSTANPVSCCSGRSWSMSRARRSSREKLRDLALWLGNERQEYRRALVVTKALLTTFPELPGIRCHAPGGRQSPGAAGAAVGGNGPARGAQPCGRSGERLPDTGNEVERGDFGPEGAWSCRAALCRLRPSGPPGGRSRARRSAMAGAAPARARAAQRAQEDRGGAAPHRRDPFLRAGAAVRGDDRAAAGRRGHASS